jgi:hypothetical protein
MRPDVFPRGLLIASLCIGCSPSHLADGNNDGGDVGEVDASICCNDVPDAEPAASCPSRTVYPPPSATLPASSLGLTARATFHSVSVYWDAAGGSASKRAFVYFRRAGDTDWREAFHMSYSPLAFDAFNPDDSVRYRGSIVHVEPNTTYEIQVALEGTTLSAGTTVRTWSETFPIGETVNVAPTAQTITITQGGTANGYRVYDGNNAVFTAASGTLSNIVVASDASYIIIRRFRLRGATGNPILIAGNHSHHVVIEDNEISDWGGGGNPSDGNRNLAIWAGYGNTQVVIQRNRIRDPRVSSPSWLCCHPGGPQGIGISPNLQVPGTNIGTNVIRYNEVYSTNGNSYGDGIKVNGHDTDVYGNYVADCHDDGFEIEGADRNVRVWSNYIANTSIPIANAPVTVGPLYVWRNVVGPTTGHPTSNVGSTNGPFMKMGFAYRTIDGVQYGVERMTGLQYIFHNTVYNAGNDGSDGLGTEKTYGDRVIRNVTSRNNILHTRSSTLRSISMSTQNRTNDFDFDLHSAAVPAGSEPHGRSGAPTYVAGSGFDVATRTGDFRLTAASDGFDAGDFIAGFSGCYSGAAPDVGAHEADANAMVFGVASSAK